MTSHIIEDALSQLQTRAADLRADHPRDAALRGELSDIESTAGRMRETCARNPSLPLRRELAAATHRLSVRLDRLAGGAQ